MPISKDAAKVSIDFTYDTDPENKDNNIEVLLKFHNTDEFGETISILNASVGMINFPARLFSEATDYLREEYGKLMKSGLASGPLSSKRAFTVGTGTKLAPTQVNKASSFLKPTVAQPSRKVVKQDDAETEAYYTIDHSVGDIHALTTVDAPKKRKASKAEEFEATNLNDVVSPDIDPEFSLKAAKEKKQNAPPQRKTFTPRGKVKNRDLE